MAMIPVKVDELFLSNLGFVVLLKGTKDERSLPIFIGAAEAQAIAIEINSVHVPRPLTHDLLKNALDFLECRLMRIEVCDLKEGTFYARLVLDRDGRMLELDSRPSDAIALALRCSAPVYVSESVMDEAGKVFDPEELRQAAENQPQSLSTAEAPKKEPRKHMSPKETLQTQLDVAVKEERYEDAARLRDEIKRLNSTHTDN